MPPRYNHFKPLGNVDFGSFYKSYLKGRKDSEKSVIPRRDDVLVCQSAIWRAIANNYLSNDGGVFIDHVGYLCHMIKPTRAKHQGPFKPKRPRKADGYKYYHFCLNLSDEHAYFTIDLLDSLREAIEDYVERGKRYKFMYREVDSERRTFGKRQLRFLKSIEKKVKR